MRTGNSTSLFANHESIGKLLQQWERLEQQADSVIRRLGKNSLKVRDLLDKVGQRVATGKWHTTGWNIFGILGRTRLEDAHSDALAWLFKPWEAHGLGDLFLREFVSAATGRSVPNGRVRDVETRKQICSTGEKIDIEVQGDGWVLAVENKIDHVETDGQTECYAEHYRNLRETGTGVFGVFLTLNRDAAEAADIFSPMSYGALRRLLESMPLNTDASIVVQWFANHIRSNHER